MSQPGRNGVLRLASIVLWLLSSLLEACTTKQYTVPFLACRGVVVRYLDKHIYIDSPPDVARLYLSHGSFLSDLAVALSGPLQLLALLPGGKGGSQLEGR
jgi:hypothetical protein